MTLAPLKRTGRTPRHLAEGQGLSHLLGHKAAGNSLGGNLCPFSRSGGQEGFGHLAWSGVLSKWERAVLKE